jgi:hypothetical protein
VLLEKLKFYGVSGKFYNLVKSYLEGRYQKIIISYNNGTKSTWKKIKQGVPQGSILGPIFIYSKAKAAVCVEIRKRKKHSTQNEHHVEFFNCKPGGT